MKATTGRARRQLPVTVAVGLGLLIGSFVLGAALHDNGAGTGIDQWFQRATAAGARHPGQPGYHHGLAVVIRHLTDLGGAQDVVFFALAASLLVVWLAQLDGRRFPAGAAFWMGLAPAIALAIAAASAEGLVKPLIDRRMIGNITILTYPSVHAAGTSAVASAAFVVLGAARQRRLARGTAGWVAAGTIAIVPLAVGLGMAVVRSHFLTDVVGGWMWGCGWGLLIGSLWGLPVTRARRRRAPRISSMASA